MAAVETPIIEEIGDNEVQVNILSNSEKFPLKMDFRTIAEAKTKLRRSRLTLVETKPLIRETKVSTKLDWIFWIF